MYALVVWLLDSFVGICAWEHFYIMQSVAHFLYNSRALCCLQDSKMLEPPPQILDPKLQLQQPEYRPAGRTQRQRSNRRKSSGASATANAVAAQSGRVNAVGVAGQYMQPVSTSVLCDHSTCSQWVPLCDLITFTVCTSFWMVLWLIHS